MIHVEGWAQRLIVPTDVHELHALRDGGHDEALCPPYTICAHLFMSSCIKNASVSHSANTNETMHTITPPWKAALPY